MREHLYFHSSNLDYRHYLKDMIEFEPSYLYPSRSDINKTLQNEYGRIKTQNHYIHIILGKIIHDGCPWCNSPGKLIESDNSTDYYKNYFLKCVNCGAQSPVLTISCNYKFDDFELTVIGDRLKYIFCNPNEWDKDFKNPYDE